MKKSSSRLVLLLSAWVLCAFSAFAQPAAPVLTEEVSCGSFVVTLTNYDAACTYVWQRDGVDVTSSVTASGQDMQYLYVNGTQSGDCIINVSVTDADGNANQSSVTLTAKASAPAAPTVSDYDGCPTNNSAAATKELSDLVTSAYTSLKWYSDAAGTTELTTTTFSLTTSGSNTYYVRDVNADGCESDLSSVTATIGTRSPLITVNNTNEICSEDGTLDLSTMVTSAHGILKYYSDADCTNEIQAEVNISTPGKPSYYITSSLAGACESLPAELILNIVTTTPQPTLSSNRKEICVGDAGATFDLASLVTDYEGVLTFYASDATTKISSAVPISTVGSVVYNVTANRDGYCESDPVSITVVVRPQATAPTTIDFSECQSSGTRYMTRLVEGSQFTELKWYTDAQGTQKYGSATFSVESPLNTTFYVADTGPYGCESPLSSVHVEVIERTATPQVTERHTACAKDGATLDLNSMVTSSTGTLKFYSDEGLSTEIQSEVSLATAGTVMYYITATEDGKCESAGAEVIVTVRTTPAAPTTEDYIACANTVDKVRYLNRRVLSNFTQLKWYYNAEGTDEITFTTFNPAQAQDVTYYVGDVGTNNCQSELSSVRIAITAQTDKPEVEASHTTCATTGGTIDLSTLVTSYVGTLKYYENEGGAEISSVISSESSLVNTYYVTATESGKCASDAAEILITVNAVPAAPTVKAYNECATETSLNVQLSTLVTSSYTALRWFSDAAGTQALSPATFDPSVVGEHTYYVGDLEDGCLSPLSEVSVTVIENSAAPTVPAAAVQLCSGSGTYPYNSLISGTYDKLTWYDADGNLISDAEFSLATAGLTNYYVTNTENGKCESPRAMVSVNINPTPEAPETNTYRQCAIAGTKLLSELVEPVEGTLVWYNSADAANPISPQPESFRTDVAGTTTYFVSQRTAAGCESTRSQVDIIIRRLPAANAGEDITICEGTQALLGTTAQQGVSYSWSPASYLVDATVAQPTTINSLVGEHTFTLTTVWSDMDMQSCRSTDDVKVTIIEMPLINLNTTSASICEGSTVELCNSVEEAGVNYSWTPAANVLRPSNYCTQTLALSESETFTLTATTAIGGCVQSGTVEVSVQKIPTVRLGDDKMVCYGGSTEVGITPEDGVSYSWSPVEYVESYNSATTNTLALTAPVTLTLTATRDQAPNCRTSDDIAISVVQLPEVYDLTGSGNYCYNDPDGATVTLSSSSSTVQYMLYKDGVATGTYVRGTGSALEWPNLTTGTYTVMAENIAGLPCALEMNGSVTIQASQPPAFVDLVPSTTSACPGTEVEIVITFTGEAPFEFDMLVNGTTTTYTSATETFRTTITPTENLYMQVTRVSDANCSTTYDSPMVYAVTYDDAVDYDIVASTDYACPGDEVTLSLSHPAEGSQIRWSTTETTETIVVTPAVSQTYTVTVTTPNGCVITDDQYIEVSPLQNITLSGFNDSHIYCSNSTPFTITPSIEGGYFSVEPESQVVTSGGYVDPSKVGVSGPYAITYTVEDTHGCSSTVTETIVVNMLIEANWYVYPDFEPYRESYQYCKPSAADIGDGYLLIGVPDATEVDGSWILDSGADPTRAYLSTTTGYQTQLLDVVAGTYTITYSVTDNAGCSSSKTKTLTITNEQTANFPVNSIWVWPRDTICINTCDYAYVQAENLGGSFTVSGGMSYTQAAGDPSKVFLCPQQTNKQGNFTAIYSMFDSQGCEKRYSKNFYVTEPRNVQPFSIEAEYCANDEDVELIVNATKTSGTITIYKDGDRDNPVLDPTNPESSRVLFRPSWGAGSYSIEYSYFDGYCDAVMTQAVTVYEATPVTFPMSLVYCYGDEITFAANPTGGRFTVEESKADAYYNNVFYTELAGRGTVDLDYVVANEHNCVSEGSTEITIVGPEEVRIMGLASRYCEPDGEVQVTGYPSTPGNGVFSGGDWVKVTGSGSATLDLSMLTAISTQHINYTYTQDFLVGDVTIACSSEGSQSFDLLNKGVLIDGLTDGQIVCGSTDSVEINSRPATDGEGRGYYSFTYNAGLRDYGNGRATLYPSQLPTGSYALSYSYDLLSETGAILCSTNQTVSFTVVQDPVIAEPSISCANSTDERYPIITLPSTDTDTEYVLTLGNGVEHDRQQGTGGALSFKEITATSTYAMITATRNGACSSTLAEPITINQLSASQQIINNASCNGAADGSVEVRISGGKAPYAHVISSDLLASDIQDSIATGLRAGTYIYNVSDEWGCKIKDISLVVTEPTALSATLSSTDISCHGKGDGRIASTVSGGSGTYVYAWYKEPDLTNAVGSSSVLDNAEAGDYKLVVTDRNGCTPPNADDLIVTIAEPDEIEIELVSKTDVVTTGEATGAISIRVTGGSGNYSYSWIGNGISDLNRNLQNLTGLVAGTYYVTVTDDQGCTAGLSVEITEPRTMRVRASVQNVTCFGGSDGRISITIEGGNGPFTVTWTDEAGTEVGNSRNLSGMPAGTYRLTLVDTYTGITINETYPISEPTATLAAELLNTTTTSLLCYGDQTGRIDIAVSGGTRPYAIEWLGVAEQPNDSYAATGLGAGSYSVSIADANNCLTSLSHTITQPDELKLEAAFTENRCYGGSEGTATLTYSGGTPEYSFLWSGTGVDFNAIDQTGLVAGVTYTVTMTDANGCSKRISKTMEAPAIIDVQETIENVSCNGLSDGSISLTVTGGEAPYAYQWRRSGSTETFSTASAISGLSAGVYEYTITDSRGCSLTEEVEITQPATLAMDLLISNVSCYDKGDASVTTQVSGGTLDYSYAWTNAVTGDPVGDDRASVSGLGTGFYSVTVTDAQGCTAERAFTITQPDAISITLSPKAVSINGLSDGAITVDEISGGTPEYSYHWTGGNISDYNRASKDPQGLTADEYYLTVTDANGCTARASATVTQPEALTVEVANTPAKCNGTSTGSLMISSVSGGSAPYAYSWTNEEGTYSSSQRNITELAAGRYLLTVTDAAGATFSRGYTVTEPDDIVLEFQNSSNTVACHGDKTALLYLSVDGGTPEYSYLWQGPDIDPSQTYDHSASGLGAGTYTVYVTDANGCRKSLSREITQNPALELTYQLTNPICYGDNSGSIMLDVTGGTGAGTYVYSWSGAGISAAAAADEDQTGLIAGSYDVIITDGNGCTLAQSFTLSTADAISLTTSKTDVTCYGAADGSLSATVTGGAEPLTYYWERLSDGVQYPDFNVDKLEPGEYRFTVIDASGCQKTENQTIDSPAEGLNATLTLTRYLCDGESGFGEVIVTGGTAPYSISWLLNGTRVANGAIVSNLAAGNYEIVITDRNGCTLPQTLSGTITQLNPIRISEVAITHVENTGDFTGAISLEVSGGSGVYEYSWTKDAIEISNELNLTGLAAGMYYLTVIDGNGCAASYSVEIKEPGSLDVVATTRNLSCYESNDGYIELSVTGGSGHVYSWLKDGEPYSASKSIYDIPAGTYRLTISYAGSVRDYTRTFVITQPEKLTIGQLSSSKLALDCNGDADGLINIEVDGGTPAYTVTWTGAGLVNPLPAPYSVSDLAAGSYTVTISDAQACVTSSTFVITQPEKLTASFLASDPQCFEQASGYIAVNAAGGTQPYSYVWTGNVTAAGQAVQENVRAGDYSYQVIDANGCSVSNSLSLEDPAEVSAVMSGGGDVCRGEAAAIKLAVQGIAPFKVVYTDGTNEYSMDMADDFAEFEVAPTVSTTYRLVSVTDYNGCEARVSGSARVNVHAYPVANIMSYNADCCLGERVDIEIACANEGPWTLYAMDQSGMEVAYSVSEMSSTISVLPPLEGSNVYNFFRVSNAYCSTELDLKAEIYAYPAAKLTVTMPTINCVGDELPIGLEITGTAPWVVDFTENGQQYSVTVNQSPYELLRVPIGTNTTYEFTRLTSGTNCVSELTGYTYEVESDDLPGQPSAITGESLVCKETTQTYRIDRIENASSYEWTLPEGFEVVAGTNTNSVSVHISSTAVDGTISVRGKNECGDGLHVSMAVDVNDDFGTIGEITSPTYLCQNSAAFQLSVPTVTSAEYYEWRLPEGYSIVSGENSSSILVQINEYARSGTVYVSPVNRCENGADMGIEASKYINIRSLPMAEAGADFSTGCSTEGQLNASMGEASTGLWTALRGEPTFSDETLYNTMVSGLLFGENPFRWTVSDGYCLGSDTVTVTNDNPGITQPEITSLVTCEEDFNLRAEKPLYGSYRWTLLSGEGTIVNPESEETMIEGLSTKSPNVIRWEVYSATCSNSVDVTIVSHSLHSLAYAGADTLIGEDYYSLRGKVVGDENVTGTWTVAAGYGEFDDPNDPLTVVRNLSPGLNTLRWTLTGYECEAYDEVQITYVDEPIANFSMDVQAGCRPLTVAFTNRTVGAGTATWYFGDGETSSEYSPSHVYSQSGTYVVKLVMTGENRSDSISATVEVYPHIDVQFYAATTQLYLPNAQANFYNETEGYTSLLWDFGNGTTSTEADPICAYAEKGTYDVRLTVTNEYGCQDSLVLYDYIMVEGESFMVFPNAFTPDLSQQNGGYYELQERRLDIFYPVSRNVDTFSMQIFNQWGIKVFESSSINQGWDGYYLGKCAVQGVYSYVAEGKYKNGESYRKSGNFVLIR